MQRNLCKTDRRQLSDIFCHRRLSDFQIIFFCNLCNCVDFASWIVEHLLTRCMCSNLQMDPAPAQEDLRQRIGAHSKRAPGSTSSRSKLWIKLLKMEPPAARISLPAFAGIKLSDFTFVRCGRACKKVWQVNRKVLSDQVLSKLFFALQPVSQYVRPLGKNSLPFSFSLPSQRTEYPQLNSTSLTEWMCSKVLPTVRWSSSWTWMTLSCLKSP